MIKETINMDGYEASLYRTKRFSTIDLQFLFSVELNKSNYLKYQILQNLIFNINAKYRNRLELTNECYKNYNTSLRIISDPLANKLIIKFISKIYNPKLIGEDFSEDALNLIYNLIYNLDFHVLLTDELLEKTKIIVYNMNNFNNFSINQKSNTKFQLSIFENSSLSNYIIIDDEELKKELDKINKKDIEDFYLNLIENSFIKLIISGDPSNKFLNLTKKLFKFKNVKKWDNPYNAEKIRYKSAKNTIVETDENNQSFIYRVYSYDKYNEKDTYLMNFLLHYFIYPIKTYYNILRKDLNLIYSGNVQFNRLDGYFIFVAQLDKKNIDKIITAFDEVINKLKDRNYLEMKYNSVLKYFINKAEIYDDDKKDFQYNIYLNELDILKLPDEIIDEYRKISIDDLLNILNKLEEKGTFIYRGDKDVQ